MSDDAKKLILSRRAKFIAAAVASVGIACGKKEEPPHPCLSVPFLREDAGQPQPCLQPVPPETTATDAGPQPIPAPCLSPMPTAKDTEPKADAGSPQPCLSVKPRPTPGPTPCLAPPLPPKVQR